jgi:hypothetical protein
MARVTTDEVKEIFKTSLTNLSAFITAANLVVENNLASSGYSDETKKEIERWLAAHFASVRSPTLRSSSLGDASEAYSRGKLGIGLSFTEFGQQVRMLDHKGILSRLGQPVARLRVMTHSVDD